MAIQLREPFFLHGRRSVLLRAIWMSFGLSAIGGCAGLVATVAVTTLDLLRLRDIVVVGMSTFGPIAVSLAMLVGIPYSRWMRHTVQGTVARAGWIVFVPTVVLASASTLPRDQREVILQRMDNLLGDPILGELAAMFSLMWLAWSTAYIRRSWTWVATAGVSALSIPLWILSIEAERQTIRYANGHLPGGLLQTLEMVSQLSVVCQFFVLLVIPWGIPFWRPPTPDASSPNSA